MTNEETKIGTVTHYFDKIGVGIIKLERELKKGDHIKFSGKKTDFSQTIQQIQLDHQDIVIGNKGQEVGIKVDDKVRDGDKVYTTE